jgi:hypothetical protein
MGGELQFPAVHGPGVYEGVTAPGTQSRSLGYMTQSGGLDPITAGRVEATEAARAYLLGQDAYAYHGMVSPKNIGGPKTDTLDINLGRTVTEPEALQITAELDRAFKGGAGIVPTENGFRVLRFSDDPKFAKTFHADVLPQLGGIVRGAGDVSPGMRFGNFVPMGWGEGNATRNFLATLDNPNAPRLPGYADSPEMRTLAGRMRDIYVQQQFSGMTPNPKLVNALGEYSTGGIVALRDLVAKGLAPAMGGLGLLGLYGQEQPYGQ